MTQTLSPDIFCKKCAKHFISHKALNAHMRIHRPGYVRKKVYGIETMHVSAGNKWTELMSSDDPVDLLHKLVNHISESDPTVYWRVR